jgi:hypothetical protein
MNNPKPVLGLLLILGVLAVLAVSVFVAGRQKEAPVARAAPLTDAEREALARKVLAAPVVPLSKAELERSRIEQMPPAQRACIELRAKTIDKRISDLTVRELAELRSCQVMEY